MTAKLARRAVSLGLVAVVVFYTAVFLFALIFSEDVSVLGARASVVDSATQPFSIDFVVDPLSALVVWVGASLMAFALVRRLAGRRTQP